MSEAWASIGQFLINAMLFFAVLSLSMRVRRLEHAEPKASKASESPTLVPKEKPWEPG